MAIVQTGSVLNFTTTNTTTGTVSTTITVPADAEMVLVGWSGYSPTPSAYSGGSMTFTKGGVDIAMTSADSLHHGDDSTGFAASLFYMVLPDTGSNKTLKWSWAATPAGDTPICSITFWKGVDIASPFRDSDGGGSGSSPPYTSLGTITAVSGDLIIAWAASFAGPEGTADSWSNLTLLSQVPFAGGASNADGAWATGSPSGATLVALSTATNWSDGHIVAASFKPSPGIALTIPQGNLALDKKIAINHVVNPAKSIPIFLYPPP